MCVLIHTHPKSRALDTRNARAWSRVQTLEASPYGTPFAQGWGMAKFDVAVPFRLPVEHGKVSACRWHVLGDVIDFQSSLRVEYEIGPGDPSLLDRYRTVAFYYR